MSKIEIEKETLEDILYVLTRLSLRIGDKVSDDISSKLLEALRNNNNLNK